MGGLLVLAGLVLSFCGTAAQTIEWERIDAEPPSTFKDVDDFYEGHHLLSMPDGGYVVTSEAGTASSTSGVVLRLDHEGNRLWLQRVEDEQENLYAELNETHPGLFVGKLGFVPRFSFRRKDGRVVCFGSTEFLAGFDEEGLVYQLVLDDSTGEPLDTISGLFKDSVTQIERFSVTCRGRSGDFINVATSTLTINGLDSVYGWLLVHGLTDRGRGAPWAVYREGGNKPAGPSINVPISMVQAEDGDFVLWGHRGIQSGGDPYLFLVKLDSLGNKVWERQPDGLNDGIGFARELRRTNDGGYIGLSGWSTAVHERGKRFNVLKFDGDGNLQWERSFDDGRALEAESICQTADGGYAVAGYVADYDSVTGGYNGQTEQWMVVWLDSLGNRIASKEWGAEPGQDRLHYIIADPDGSVVVTGNAKFYPTRLYVAKLRRDTTTGVINAGTSGSSASSIRVQPNPVHDRVRIEWHSGRGERLRISRVGLYDMLGRRVLSGPVVSGLSGSMDLDVSEVPTGTYRAVGETENGGIGATASVMVVRY